MSNPLLITKLYIPPHRPELVKRPHLTERLTTELHKKLTLISAPAGFGKTTLLTEWIHGDNWPVAWLSLDEGDNDPARFLTYFITALQTVTPNIGDGILGALQSAQPTPFESLLMALINEIAAIPLDNPEDPAIILILDDYHLIEARAIDDALSFLLARLPPQLHLVIASRADPSLPLARLRARRQLTELRTPDLRFRVDEAAVFLNQVMGLNISADDVAVLEKRTEGWITGLQLAGLSVQGLHSDDRPAFIADFTGSHRYVFDYLADEVLLQQSEDIRSFLLHTSILNRLTGSLCDAVSGQHDGQETLQRLEVANLFIIPLDTERHWYRYHHLFADLLRQRLQQLQPDTIFELHRRASHWYEQNEVITEALGHALAAADYERATQLVAANALLMLTRGQVSTVQDWLDALPQASVRAHPRLCIDQAWALYLTNRPSAVESYLLDAERGLQLRHFAEQPTTAGWHGEVMALRAWVKRSEGDLDQAIELSQQALARLTEKQMFVRCMNILSLAGAWLYSDNPSQAIQALTDCIPKCMADGNPLGVMGGAYDLAELQVIRGRLHQAKTTLQDALAWATEQGVQRLPAAALLYVGLGDVLLEQNDLAAAQDHLEAGLRLSELGLKTISNQGYLSLARLKQAQGDQEGSREAFQNTDQAARRWEIPQTAAELVARRVRLLLAQGNLAAGIQWRRKAGRRPDERPTYLREFELITLARVLIVEGRAQHEKSILSDALTLLERLQQTAEAGDRMGRVMEILVLRALAFEAQGNTDAAMPVLERALNLAAPEGYVRIFVDEDRPMARLLYEATARGIVPDYAGNLLAVFPDADSAQAQRLRSEGVEPLSQREVEVLHLIAEGLSNRELAARLSLSLNTVKVHTRNLYSKLNVNSRAQAVAKARTLDILSS